MKIAEKMVSEAPRFIVVVDFLNKKGAPEDAIKQGNKLLAYYPVPTDDVFRAMSFYTDLEKRLFSQGFTISSARMAEKVKLATSKETGEDLGIAYQDRMHTDAGNRWEAIDEHTPWMNACYTIYDPRHSAEGNKAYRR